MAVRQYIGARYVPKFDGDWDPTKQYEPLTIVSYLNNSYTSKQTVPVGTVPTDTTYWALTGNYNAQVETYRQQVDALQAVVDKIPTNRKFILVGDSFGFGVKGDGSPWTDGWIDYMNQLLPGQCFYYDPGSDPLFPGTAGFLGTQPYYDLMKYAVDNKLGTVLPEEITDVVFIGGNNEPNTASAADIAAEITGHIKPYIDATLPNAKVSIACLGLNARHACYDTNAYKGYEQGAREAGYNFIPELLNLGTDPTYDSGYGHWSDAGYAKYNPYVAQAVITGHTTFSWYKIFNLTLGTNVSITSGMTCALIMNVDEQGVSFRIIDTSRYRGWFLTFTGTLPPGTITVTAFTFTDKIYTAFVNSSNIDRGYMTDNGLVNGDISIFLKINSLGNNEIDMAGFPFNPYSQNTDCKFVWEGTILNKVLIF